MSHNNLPTAQLEVFNDVADILESMNVFVLSQRGMADEKEGLPLKENHLIRSRYDAKFLQTLLDLLCVVSELCVLCAVCECVVCARENGREGGGERKREKREREKERERERVCVW